MQLAVYTLINTVLIPVHTILSGEYKKYMQEYTSASRIHHIIHTHTHTHAHIHTHTHRASARVRARSREILGAPARTYAAPLHPIVSYSCITHSFNQVWVQDVCAGGFMITFQSKTGEVEIMWDGVDGSDRAWRYPFTPGYHVHRVA